ncbi:MAG: hypothetical protein DMF61_06895 [Blastocatellia bacterium AA13]|nr:MAG: hypothetical protein DMF61_06895 [Blastocatellia bacterium AA13]
MRHNVGFSKTMMKGLLPLICAALIAVAPVPGDIYAQSSSSTGRLQGVVQDQDRAVIAQAEIRALSETSGAEEKQVSDAEGHFVFLALEPGAYRVTVSKTGFEQMVFNHVAINVGTTTTLQPMMGVASQRQEVTVEATSTTTASVDTATSSISTVIGNRVIGIIPLNGRSFTDFVLLTPGSTTDGDFGMVSFNGMAGNYNNYTVDGANDNNAFYSQQIGRTSIPFQFSEDVIHEFQVTSTGFKAEFGQAGGGLVNTVTKSGGNAFHGDGYYYVLDSSMNANDSINNSAGINKPENRRQQFGATVTGPLRKDRLFYVANYEGQVRREPLVVNNAPAHLDQLPAGFFAANPGLQQAVAAASGSFPRTFNQNAAFGKVNAKLSERNYLIATYNYQRFRSPHGFFTTPTSTGDGLSLTDGATSHFVQLSLGSFINASTVNEFAIHFGRDTHFDLPATPPTSPTITIQNPDTGFVLGGNRVQLSETDSRYQARDGLTKVIGKHEVKVGADFNLNRENNSFIYAPKGEYRFADLESVASGAFELYLQSFGQPTVKFHSPSYGLFAQDDYRVTDHLTVNYGVRWDLQVMPQPKTCNPALPLTCNIPYSRANIAPRVGFAYAFGRSGKTVLRGSFGLYYVPENLLDVAQALAANGIAKPFLVATGPGFGNNNPIVTFPNSLTAFPSGVSGTPSVVVFSPDFRSPYVEQGNIGLEHQIGKHLVVGATYVYSHGLALLGNSNGVTRQANGNFGFDLNLVPSQFQTAFDGSFTTATVNLPNGQSFVVPDFEAIDGFFNPNFGAINAIDNSGKSVYHALQTSVRYVSPQFYGLIGYTLSKNTDQGTGYFNQFDQRSQRGPSLLNQTNRFVLSAAWLPQMRGLKGFTFAAAANFAGGRPYTAVFDTPQVNFSIVPGLGFNSFRSAGVETIDFSVARTIKIKEGVSLTFAAQAFDLLNHANFQQGAVDNVKYTLQQRTDNDGNDSAVWDATVNPSFDQPLAAAPRYGSRNLQFSVRISF